MGSWPNFLISFINFIFPLSGRTCFSLAPVSYSTGLLTWQHWFEYLLTAVTWIYFLLQRQHFSWRHSALWRPTKLQPKVSKGFWKIMATGMVVTYLRGNNLSCLSGEDSIVSETSAFDFLLVGEFISKFISRLKMSYFDPKNPLFCRNKVYPV